MLLIEYPKCSTCKKAKKFLDDNNIKYEQRHIVENNPTYKELKKWIKDSNKDINIFFNTSGLKYKELKLKEKIKYMTEDEKIKLLSTDGMLVKRPLFILDDNSILIGFKENEWKSFIK